MGELVPVCGDEPFRTIATLPEWVQCNITVLLFLVFLTIMVLFVVGILVLLLRFR